MCVTVLDATDNLQNNMDESLVTFLVGTLRIYFQVLRGTLAASAASEPLARTTPSSHLTLHLCRRRPAPSRYQPAGPR